jgi:H+/Cl- antiporter ClcA
VPHGAEDRRRRARRLRRLGLLAAVGLIAAAVILFSGITVSSDGTHEWLNGRQDTQSLLLPLLLFLLGMIALALCLPDRGA